MRRQADRFFNVDEEYKESLFEAAKEYGVSVAYSNGAVRLHGAFPDVQDVIYSKFELYDEDEVEKERNREQPIRSILTRLDPEEQMPEFDSVESQRSEKRFGYLLEDDYWTEEKPVAIATDGGQPQEDEGCSDRDVTEETIAEIDHGDGEANPVFQRGGR